MIEIIGVRFRKNTKIYYFSPEEKKYSVGEKVIVETEKGVKPELPAKVKATFDIGLPRDVEVTWDEIDEAKYNEYGVFEVKGTVEGQELKATAKVVVKGISALGNLALVTNVGVEPTLPDTVKAYYTDGTVKDLAVVWEEYNKELCSENN